MNESTPSSSSDTSLPARHRGLRPCTAALLCVLIFLSGAIVGGGATVIIIKRTVWYTLQHPQALHEWAAKGVSHSLGLTEAQSSAVRDVWAQYLIELNELRMEVEPRVHERLRELRDDVAAQLTPEQATEWRTWFDQVHANWTLPLPDKEELPVPKTTVSEGGKHDES